MLIILKSFCNHLFVAGDLRVDKFSQSLSFYDIQRHVLPGWDGHFLRDTFIMSVAAFVNRDAFRGDFELYLGLWLFLKRLILLLLLLGGGSVRGWRTEAVLRVRCKGNGRVQRGLIVNKTLSFEIRDALLLVAMLRRLSILSIA